MRTIGFASPISGFSEQENARRQSIVAPWLPDGFQVRPVTSPASPKFLDSHDDFAEAIESNIRFFGSIDPDEFDVIVLAGAIDPALPALREACPVPVIGAGEAALYLAAISGKPLSIVTVDEYAVAATTPFLEQTVRRPPIVSVRSTDTPVRAIVENRQLGIDATHREAKAAVEEDGAQAIYLGCVTLGTLGIVEALQKELEVPIYDPLRIVIATAVQASYARRP